MKDKSDNEVIVELKEELRDKITHRNALNEEISYLENTIWHLEQKQRPKLYNTQQK